jgi:hypothetical protein
MSELNPDNPLVGALREHWQKICAILMSKQKAREVRINSYDIDKLSKAFAPDAPAVVAHIENAGTPQQEIVLRLMDQTTAVKLMRDYEKGNN